MTLTEAEVLALFEACSNKGRWGVDDELGTLNYITSRKRVEAAGLVREGRLISLARTLPVEATRAQPIPVRHRMHYVGRGAPFCVDSFDIFPHGYGITHLDAVGHWSFEGEIYNGRRAAEAVTAGGLAWGSVMATRSGVVTRAVLLDVAAARGVDWLSAGEPVTPEDLDAAERLTGTRVESGDAILVRIGLPAREAVEGGENPRLRAGLTPDCLRWLHDREVAVYGGDCNERIPSGYSSVIEPLHQIGMVAMGLCILDNTDLEELAGIARETGRYVSMIVIGPLLLPQGTGSPVNPICLL